MDRFEIVVASRRRDEPYIAPPVSKFWRVKAALSTLLMASAAIGILIAALVLGSIIAVAVVGAVALAFAVAVVKAAFARGWRRDYGRAPR